MRRAVLGLVTVISLCLLGMAPASAASTPSKVGLVSFVASAFSPTSSGGTASMTLDWPGASNAKSYEIFMSTSYTMSSPKRYTSIESTKKVVSLKPGTDYFFQVRGVNGSAVGSKSTRVGHTTIRAKGSASGPQYRVMTYNVCSVKCDSTTATKWLAGRQDRAHGRISAYKPDVVAAQEASKLVTPPGYKLAYDKSAKRLLFKETRFTLAPPDQPLPPKPDADSHNCSPTWNDGAKGHVLLGYHSYGCRYAVWAELIDIATGQHVIFSSVHLVAGKDSEEAELRKAEVYELLEEIGKVKTAKLPVVYAGDFNSHKNRVPDWVGYAFNKNGYYDAYDLAMTLYRQHNNSYNDFKITPVISYKWGDHVDHVFVVPSKTRVIKWASGAWIANGKMVTPIPSDHSPIVIDVQVN